MASTQRRQQRYVRSSTTASVTQLLSDSYNNIVQRFRRMPSEKYNTSDKLSLASNRVRLNEHHHHNGNNSSLNDIDNTLLSSCGSESNRGTKTMKSTHSTADYGHLSSSDNIPGRFSSALNRIKYSYDYKPLMRTITRRFDSPTKSIMEETSSPSTSSTSSSALSSTKDKEKTPVIGEKSVISRLESKYSDILDRVAKRKEKQRQEQNDRDKTLEPDDRSRKSNALMKSATTANILKSSFGGSGSTTQKERTPFRFERNKNKYQNHDNNVDTISSSSGVSSSSSINGSKVKRSDILGSTSIDDFPSSSYSKLKSHDSGYYDGSYYKSKYDDLLSDVTNNRSTPKKVTMPYTGSATTRQLKPYKRSDGTSGDKHRTAINLYDLLDNNNNESSSSSSKQVNGNGHYRRQYTQRKSAGHSLRTTYNDTLSSATDDSSDDFSDYEKTERENRRKEIQSLIMKYAQLDDFYGKSSRQNGSDESISKKKDKNNNSDLWDTKAQSPVVIPMKQSNSKLQASSSRLNGSSGSSGGFNALGKSQTMANISHYQSNYDYDMIGTSWYGSNYSNSSKNKGGNVVPITTYAQKSSSKSRMSKALSTFVRKMK